MARTRTVYDSPKKNRFIGVIESGMHVREAGRKYGITKSSADRIWRKYLEMGTTHTHPRSGRPRKVTQHVKRVLVRESKKNRRLPLRELGKRVEPAISASTVRRALAEEGIHRRKARKVPFLTPKQKRARLLWAKKYVKLLIEDWKHVIWSDECYIYLGDKKGDIWVTRSSAEVWHEDCLVPKFQQSSIRVMMWGCIAYGKKGPLIVLEYPGGKGGGMTALRYQQQVLSGPFYDFYEEMSLDRGYATFQQDGASCHRAPSTVTWLSHHAVDIFPHTASSPDLSPIEPVWKLL